MPNTYSITGANEAVCISLKAAGDTLLPNELPQAEYMYGCVPTAIGMLLGYYDLYGYTVGSKTYDFSNLIPGTISVKSRGNGDGDIYDMSDSSVLAKFIASPEYVSRFVGKTPAQEKPYTFVGGDPDKGLNTSIWNCLADYLGAGQYWRGSGDYFTQYYSQSLSWLLTTSHTKTTDGIAIPAKYYDYKYGLYLYVESVGYELDPDKTCTYKLENNEFTFSTLKSEIDAGRPVLFSLKNEAGGGHMVIVYGYNASTGEIIFDDTYRAGCRMDWDGTYTYSGAEYYLYAATPIVFSVNAENIKPDIKVKNPILAASKGATSSDSTLLSDSTLYLSADIINEGSASTGRSFTVRIYVDNVKVKELTVNTLAAGGRYSLNDIALGTFEAGAHSWKIQADCYDVVDEIDENNTITGSFDVSRADGYRVIQNVLNISSAQSSSCLLVQSGGRVYNLGKIDDMILSSGGVAYISRGGTASNVMIGNSGSMYVYSQGSAHSVEVSSGGQALVQNQGTVTDLRVANGGKAYISGTASHTNVASNGSVYIYNGGVMTGSATFSVGAKVVVSSGGEINFDITSRQPGTQVLINNLSLISGSPSYTVTVTASKTTGIYALAAGASSFNQTITIKDSAGTRYGAVSVGGSVLNYNGKTYSLLKSSGILSLQIASTLQNGWVGIYSSGTLVSQGGNITSMVLRSGSVNSMFISSGGVAHSTFIKAGGVVHVCDGGRVNTAVVSSRGTLNVSSGGTADKTIVMKAGNMMVARGGIVNSTFVDSKGKFNIAGNANSTTMAGIMSALSGAVLSNTTIADDGRAVISAGATLHNIKVNDSLLELHNYAELRGEMNFAENARVTTGTGTIINFTLAGRTSASGYLANNLSVITGSEPDYTITISNDQAAGTYKLAQKAELYDTVTIRTAGSVLGKLTVNGDVLVSDGMTYDLNCTDAGDLTLTITGAASVETERFAAGKFSTAGGLFEFTTDGTGFIHASSGKTQISGTLNTSTWGLLAAGDFNHSGNDGLLWLEKSTGKLYAQNSLSNFNEVTNKTNYLGTVGAGGGIIYAGDFTGTGFDCALINNAVSGSDYYDLTVQGKLSGGSAFTGSLAKLHNAWQTGDTLKGNTSKAADVNAKNYMFDVAAVGDFNGDGADDVLIRNVIPASVNGVNVTGSGDLFTFLTGDMDDLRAGEAPTVTYVGNAASNLEIEGIGDFNGDGTDDLLLLQDLKVSVWKMKNGLRTGVQDIGYISANQEIAGIADLNNDGTDDVILYNRSTDTYMGWQLKNYYNNSSIVLA